MDCDERPMHAPTGPLPAEWLKRWQSESPVPLVETWEDPDSIV